MYVGAGDNGTFAAGLFRSDDATAAAPAFTDITTIQSAGYCGAQCWYDNVVYSPPGQPDALYLGGSYDYDNAGVPVLGGDTGKRTNGRAFIYSTDAGANFSDLTRDAGPAGSQDGMHPDQHAIAISPTNPDIVFFGSDGGIMRSSGTSPTSRRSATTRAERRQPRRLQAAPVARPDAARQPQLGAADAAVPEPLGRPATRAASRAARRTTAPGSATQATSRGTRRSGATAASPASTPRIQLRFNTFTGQANDGNFRGGDPSKWVVITGEIVSSPEGA